MKQTLGFISIAFTIAMGWVGWVLVDVVFNKPMWFFVVWAAGTIAMGLYLSRVLWMNPKSSKI
jgi:hypothetical protein